MWWSSRRCFPQQLKPRIIVAHFRRGLKPRPFRWFAYGGESRPFVKASLFRFFQIGDGAVDGVGGTAQGFGKRIGDGTTEAVSRLTDIGVGDSLERVLFRAERAVAKLDDGSYGICDACGDPISPGRMRALPDGVLCLRCAASERRTPAPRRR